MCVCVCVCVCVCLGDKLTKCVCACVRRYVGIYVWKFFKIPNMDLLYADNSNIIAKSKKDMGAFIIIIIIWSDWLLKVSYHGNASCKNFL